MNRPFWLFLGLAAALWGCGPAVSPQLQREARLRVSFAEIAAHPDRYQGQLVILGGEVMEVQPLGGGSLLLVDQRELDSRLYPAATASGGNFLVESDQWLDSNHYLPKSKVTVAGTVAGKRDGVPTLKARQVTLVEPPRWEKWYYPVPREWYDPSLEYWYTPPYFDIYRHGGRH